MPCQLFRYNGIGEVLPDHDIGDRRSLQEHGMNIRIAVKTIPDKIQIENTTEADCLVEFYNSAREPKPILNTESFTPLMQFINRTALCGNANVDCHNVIPPLKNLQYNYIMIYIKKQIFTKRDTNITGILHLLK